MATQLFKDGSSIWVEARKVSNHLEAGWSATDPSTVPVKHPEVIYPPTLKIDTLTQAQAEAEVLKQMGIEPKRRGRKPGSKNKAK